MKNILIQPFITEKTMGLAAFGWYTFVTGDVGKSVIAQAVKEQYKVDVTAVRTISMHGKVKRGGKRMRSAKRPDWKKAIVCLKKGQTIDAFQQEAK